MWWELAQGVLMLSLPLAGYFVGNRQAKHVLPQIPDVQRYMWRVVNAEEADERFNLTRKMLHDAGRRTMPRMDSGPEARVSRMRVRRGSSRVRIRTSRLQER